MCKWPKTKLAKVSLAPPPWLRLIRGLKGVVIGCGEG